MSHVTDLFCRFSFCFREHMISFCLSWNRNTALICSRDDASAICEGKQMGPGGAPLLVFFFFPRNINFHMVLKIVSVGWIQTTPLWTSALLTGASEGLLWSGFRLVWGHFPEWMVNQRLCHTKAVRAYAARHAAPHWSGEQGIKGQRTFLTTHSTVQSHTREMFSLTRTGNELLPESVWEAGSLIIQWAGVYKDHFGMENRMQSALN